MKPRHARGLTALAALAIAASLYAADQVPLTARQTTGMKYFLARCGYCHLEGETGTLMLTRRLGEENALLQKRSNLDPNYVRSVVRTGILSMPALTRVEVTDDELDAIVDYLTRANPKSDDRK